MVAELALLEEIAQAAQRDISGTFPELTEGQLVYDLYIEDLFGQTWGLIDMGEYYQRAFRLEMGRWEESEVDPRTIHSEILLKRGQF